MLRLEVEPAVLKALKTAFPKPSGAALKALRKYVSALNDLLTEAIRLGNDPYGARFHLFSISLHQLANRGGQIGPKRIRTHAWLKENGLALVEAIELGSNLSGQKSRVRLTRLVTLVDELSLASVQIKHSANVKGFLDHPSESEVAWIRQIYPALDQLDEVAVNAQYHITDIDLESLGRFIIWIAEKARHIPKSRRDMIFRQAVLIYRVAKFSDGIFLQKIKRSHFGRTYYEGISVQNVHRTLRQAMLGDSWEYDIVSAVVAWKLGFGERFRQVMLKSQSVAEIFPTMLIYLQDKDDLIKTIRADTYLRDSEVDAIGQRKQVKSALTALCFGARVGASGWHDDAGMWKVPAIGSIFKDVSERKRFVMSRSTKAFINEQRKLDQFIFDLHLASNPSLKCDPRLQTESGRVSRAKVLAYLYQHAETAAMDIVRRELAQVNNTVLANIHDAIIVREKLSLDVRNVIEDSMRRETGNVFWRVSQKQIKRFES
jgi:hypothetical protein